MTKENGLSYDALVMLVIDVQEGKFEQGPIVDALRELIDRRADERVAATLASVDDGCLLGHEPAMSSALEGNYRSLGYCRKCGVSIG